MENANTNTNQIPNQRLNFNLLTKNLLKIKESIQSKCKCINFGIISIFLNLSFTIFVFYLAYNFYRGDGFFWTVRATWKTLKSRCLHK